MYDWNISGYPLEIYFLLVSVAVVCLGISVLVLKKNTYKYDASEIQKPQIRWIGKFLPSFLVFGLVAWATMAVLLISNKDQTAPGSYDDSRLVNAVMELRDQLKPNSFDDTIIVKELTGIRDQLSQTNKLEATRLDANQTQTKQITDALNGIRDRIPSGNDILSGGSGGSNDASNYWLYIIFTVLVLGLVWLLIDKWNKQDSFWIKIAKGVPIVAAIVSGILGILASLLMFTTGTNNIVDAFNKMHNDPTSQSAPVLSVLNVMNESKERPLIIGFNNQIPVVPPKPDKSSLSFIVPFMQEGNCSAADSGQWVGTQPDQAFKAFLQDLSHDLRLCGTEKTPASVVVRGFASSSEVRNPTECYGSEVRKPKESDDDTLSDGANLLIAEARRRNVQAILNHCEANTQCTDGKVCEDRCKTLQVIGEKWTSFADMVAARHYNDRWLDRIPSYSKERGILNRRVEIRLKNLGECGLSRSGRIERSTTDDKGSSGT